MTKQFARSQSLLIAARQNLHKDIDSLVWATTRRIQPAHRAVVESEKIEGRVPTIEEGLAALRAALTPTEEERATALRIAADLRMAGVSREEIARAMGTSPGQVSRMLSSYPESTVTKAGQVIFDAAQERWVTPDSATATPDATE